MSAAGPALPPHLLAKRERRQEEEEQNEQSAGSGAKRSQSPTYGEKRRRLVGPAMPPAPLDERPTEPPSSAHGSDSDDDDDFGPAPPPEEGKEGANEATKAPVARREPTPEARPQRDAWMTMPPQQDDLATRMDPARQRPRGFNTGKGAKAPAASGNEAKAWHETAEQKQKRLVDEMMGISSAATAASAGPQRSPARAEGKRKDGVDAKKVKQARGPSLMDQHKAGKGKEAEDDDPSKRTFDREKDMGAGMKIGHAQRVEMLKKAGGFSSKFAGGSYL